MRAFIILAVVAAANAGLIAAPHAVAVGAHATQYHAQDELGQYSYGYAGGPSSKAESKTADGVVRGAYSYVDGNGLVQSVNYVADPVNGFRVAATNLPVGPAPVAPVVAAAPIVAARAIAPAVVATPAVAPVAYTAAAAPIHYAAAPVAYTAVAPTYVAKAAPLNNGAVHIASLPLPPADTPEVVAARSAHLLAKLG